MDMDNRMYVVFCVKCLEIEERKNITFLQCLLFVNDQSHCIRLVADIIEVQKTDLRWKATSSQHF